MNAVQESPWLSESVGRLHWIPGIIILFTLSYDLSSIIHWPKSARAILHAVRSPFQNFLTLDDLEEPIGDAMSVPAWKTRALVALAIVESTRWLLCTLFSVLATDSFSTIPAVVASITWAYTAFRVVLKPPTTPPYLSLLFASTHVVAALVDLAFYTIEIDATLHTVIRESFPVFLPALFIWVGGTFPLQLVQPAKNVAKPGDTPSNALSCPEDDVNLWSWMSFSFVDSIFHLATSQTLDDTDVWSLSPFFRHKNLFNKYLEYRSLNPSHTLLRLLLVSNSLDLIIDVAAELWGAVIRFVQPYALKEILSSLEDPNGESKSAAYYWTLVIFIAHLSFAQIDLFQSWHTRRCYERTRGQLFCALHYKALMRLDVSGKVSHEQGDHGSADLGKIVNLMQGDAYSVSQRFWEFSALFASPVRLIIAFIFLYKIIGWSALSGVCVILIAYVFNYPLGKYNIHITRSSWKAKDRRMNVVNELLQNIRFLKFYGWENQWSRKAREAREAELQWRVKENVINTLISFIWTWIPSATALSSFFCYTIFAGERLTVAKAFTSIALFAALQDPMTALPGQVFAMLHAYVSMQRIEGYLSEPEVPDWASSLKAAGEQLSSDCEVAFTAATFEWHGLPKSTMSTRFQLGPLNINFPIGKLTLVSGATGSGKSALLTALLGEMCCLSGSVRLDKTNHKVAYCAQNPWLEHASIRDNIVFGSNLGFDSARYQAVIGACALEQDLKVFDAGDLTEIGEKGITLSGGQRARIALARAMYSQAKYILLDDPLAAVDMHTAQHIVEKCFSGSLTQDRTIILVTHHIMLCLPMASYLIELSHGQVVQKGTIPSLREQGVLDQVVEAENDEAFAQENQSVLTAVNEADALHNSHKPNLHSGKLVEEEARAEGRVSLQTYLTYIRAAGFFSWILTLVLMLLIRFINVGNQVFLAAWGDAYSTDGTFLMKLFVSKVVNYPWARLPPPDINVKPWLMIYLYISLAGATSVFAYISLGYYASLQASRSLFISLLQTLTRAQSRWFDVTPIGRILNRFTTDINTIDGALQNSARGALSGILNFLVSFSVILFLIPSFAPFALLIAFLYIRLAPPYVRASRDLRRLESVSLSPTFAGFDELLRGLAHVRAFAMETRYQERFYQKVDKFQSFDHVYWLVNGWLRWRYDCLGSVIVFLATIFALWNGVTDGKAAIVIVQAGAFADASRQLVKFVSLCLELDFNSVERVVEYLSVPQEAPPIIETSRPSASWPTSGGSLIVQDLIVRYALSLPDALQKISFSVRPTEKIAIVGRTGSGKSTLALSLMRMVEPREGKIIIDGVDISTIGLEDLRNRITIVSQDVSLFSGTIRSNLDPFEEHTDQACLDVLERCHLTSLMNGSTNGRAITLDMPITQGGSLSAGERQLVALARAVLRRTNIIILDEATSQIDSNLDDQIQQTIREQLSYALVITIAHRLKTIIDYDRILVLDGGKILEFDEPKALLKKPNGAFREMCQKSTDWTLLAHGVDELDGTDAP